MNVKSILAGTLALGIVCTSALTTFASDIQAEATAEVTSEITSTDNESAVTTEVAAGKHTSQFEKLLTDGVISQATYDAMTAYMAENMPERPEGSKHDNLIDTLLEAGIITQDECDAMKEIAPISKEDRELAGEGEQSNRFAEFEAVLSQETIAAIEAYMEANRPEQAEGSKHMGLMAELLEADIITQAEYDTMKEITGEGTKGNHFAEFEAVLSQETISAIKAYLEENKPVRAEGSQRPDFMAEMVDAGIITQEEHDLIKAAMPERTKATADESANSSEGA